MSNVAYLCDGKQCEACDGSTCFHTFDLAHAKNFERIYPGSSDYCEKQTSHVDVLTERYVHKIIDEAMKARDRSVSIYFGEFGTSVSVYPYPDPEDEEKEE